MANKTEFCHYYNSEETNPFKDADKSLFWEYERVWASDDTTISDDDIDEYINIGLRTFEQYDGTPLSLKAVLFNRFCKWKSYSMLDCVDDFKDWYINKYKKG